MNTKQNTNEVQDGEAEANNRLSVASALAKAKRRAVLRDLGRTAIAALTAVLMAKGMELATHNNNIAWAIAFATGACFWALGMWYWKEIDG